MPEVKVAAVASFRQRQGALNGAVAAHRQRSSSAYVRRDQQYQPTEGRVQDLIRLVPGNYTLKYVGVDASGQQEMCTTQMEYYNFVQHYDARHNRFIQCSAGPWYFDSRKADKCYACDEFWNSMTVNPSTGKKERGYIGRSDDTSAVTLIHFHPYHEVPQTDKKTGRLVLNKQTKQPYKEWVRCEGKGCRYCVLKEFQVFETKPARKLVWVLSQSQRDAVWTLQDAAEQRCAVCGDISVGMEAWYCPQCQYVFFDEKSQAAEDYIYAQTSQRMVCPNCGPVYPVEAVYCTNPACNADATNPVRRATIFDANIRIRRYKSGNSKKWEFSSQLDSVGPIAEAYAELATPFPLDKLYAPTPLPAQAKILEIEVGKETAEETDSSSESYDDEEEEGAGES